MTITELKARAYDILTQIEFLQSEFRKLNEEIKVKIQSEVKENT